MRIQFSEQVSWDMLMELDYWLDNSIKIFMKEIVIFYIGGSSLGRG
jgi:hypothetical protein